MKKINKIKKIKLKGKTIEAEVCDTLWKRARGLMFKKKSKPLLFVFKKPTRQSIHSLFCKPFFAIWFFNGKIIEEKVVKPFSFSVKPKTSFSQLIEIPLKDNNKLFENIRRE